MLNRLKKAWMLAAKEPEAIAKLTKEQIQQLPNIGDGNAVFFSEGSEEDFREDEREDKGLKGLFGL